MDENVSGSAVATIDLKIRDEGGVPVVNSRAVAPHFRKRHDHVLRDIDNLIGSPELGNLTIQGVAPFRLANVQDEAANKEVRSFDMTRDGVIVTDSVSVASSFGKSHKHILRDIDGLLNVGPDLGPRSWFLPTTTSVPGPNGADAMGKHCRGGGETPPPSNVWWDAGITRPFRPHRTWLWLG
jgi:phage regulator Rha-like protein